MLKSYKMILSLLLSLSMFCSLLTPAFATNSNVEMTNLTNNDTLSSTVESVTYDSNDFVANRKKYIETVYDPAQWQSDDYAVLPDPSDNGNKNLSSNAKDIKPLERMNAIKNDFTPLMQQITAYFYHEFAALLDEKQQKEMLTWNVESINTLISSLSKNQIKQLDKYAPVVTEQFDYHRDPSAYKIKHPNNFSKSDELKHEKQIKIDNQNVNDQKQNGITKQKTSNQVSILSVNDYKVTPFKNEYNYSSSTDGLVNTLYNTANRSVTDLSLAGKEGLDIQLERNYNSMQSKILSPSYTAYKDASGNYTQSQGNNGETIIPSDIPGFIATGWSMNLPSMQKAVIQAEVVPWTYNTGCLSSGSYQGTGYCYRSGYSYQSVSQYEKVSFSLDNGLSVEFRNGVAFDYPYQNLTYAKNYNSTTNKYEYSITVDSKITYKFDDQGKIISKTNPYGNQVTYFFSNDTVNGVYNITITDSYGRKITVFRNATSVITGFKVEDGTTLLKQVQYNVLQSTVPNMIYRKWTSNGYTNVTENLSYWQLNDVKDTTQGSTTLESYEYLPVDSTKLADFNMKPDGYAYDYSSPTGELVLAPNQEYNYWSWVYTWVDANGQATVPYELVQIANANTQTYGEIPFLLVKNINLFNGLQVQFSYQNYSPGWSSDSNPVSQDSTRNSTRLYQDKNAIQYYSYHQVTGVNYIFTENGSTQNLSENYSNIHKDHGWQINEYWKNNKQNIARLRTTSRFGSQQTLKNEIVRASYGDVVTYNQYSNNGNNYVLTANWKSTNNPSNGINKLSITDNGVEYSHKDEVVYYEYDPNKVKPRKVSRFGYEIADSLTATATTSFMNINSLPNTTSKLSNAYTYDSWGYPLTELDEIGNQTTHVYNGPFHQTTSESIQSQDGNTQLSQLYTYNAGTDPDVNKQNQLSQTKKIQKYLNPSTLTQNTDSVTTDYMSYNTDKMPLQIKQSGIGDQFGSTSTITQRDFTYNNRGQILTASTLSKLGTDLSPSTITLIYDYDSLGRLKTTTYPDGKKVVNELYDSLNRLTSQTFIPVGVPGKTTNISYVDNLRKVTVSMPDQERQESIYSPFGELIQTNQIVKDLTNTDQSRITLKNQFSIFTRSIVSNLPFNNGSLSTTSYLDSFGRFTMVNNPYNLTTYAYANVAKNIATGVETLQNVMQSVQQDGMKQISYYDSYGRLVKVVEQTPNLSKTRIITNTYNSLGQLKTSTVTSGVKSQTTQYGYDGWGQLIYLQDDKGQKHQYVYNRLGQVSSQSINGTLQKQMTYNEIGWVLSKTNGGGLQEKYIYKNNGQMENYTDKSGQKTVYSYTPYGEQDRVSILNPSNIETFWQQFTYDPNNHLLLGVSNSENETLGYHYDIWKRNDWKIVAGKKYTFGYDDFDRMNSIMYPDNHKVTYTFDSINRIKTVNYKDASNNVLMSPVTYTYTQSSNVHVYAEAFANGLKQEKFTDAFKELTIVNHYKSSTTANWTETFGYDGFGNISNITRNSIPYSFTYDGLNRIQQENSSSGQNVYTYDDKGNRQTLESDNLISDLDSSKDFTYNALNQLKTFTNNAGTTASYTYYGDGLRATKTVNGELTRYVYVEGKVVDELDANGNSKARNIWGNELLYRKNSTATDTKSGYYFFNGHGDVVKVTDNSGNVLNSYDYDIWGNITSKTETMNNPFKYTGEIQDEETGYIYLRARYYDPSIGRFINEDTYEGDISNPLTLNLYTYVANNPLTHIDPTGHYWQTTNQNQFNYLTNLSNGTGGNAIWAKSQLANNQKSYATWVDTNPKFDSGNMPKYKDPYAGMSDAQVMADLQGIAQNTINAQNGNDAWMKKGFTDASEIIATFATAGITAEVRAVVTDLTAFKNINPLSNVTYTDKVLKQMGTDAYHGFSIQVDNFGAYGNTFNKTGGDGIVRTWVEIPGQVNDVKGVYQYIIEPNGSVNHRLFVPRK